MRDKTSSSSPRLVLWPGAERQPGVLDDQEPVQAARDRYDISAVLGPAATVVYDHRPSRDEPLLWAIDAMVWASGAGSEWSRRVSLLLTTQTVP